MGGNQWDSTGKGSNVREVLSDWYQRVAATQRAHYVSADHLSRKGYWPEFP